MTDVSKYYKIEGDKLVRTHRSCPKCGPSVFMAEHYDRFTCGNCKYTVFKRKGTKGGQRKRSPRKRKKSS
ncbi:MAG: 30S ribosomal protein S27ae [Promethearchaeota archaeon]|nr:MAG: 30S ribosomal protein S27ae [Candidatus Lokiarchaeota archaeon]